MPFGALFESKSETNTPTVTDLGQAGSNVQDAPGLVLNVTDARSINAGGSVQADDGASQLGGRQSFTVNSTTNVLNKIIDGGLVDAARALGLDSGATSRRAIDTVERMGGDFLDAVNDTASLFASSTDRIVGDALDRSTRVAERSIDAQGDLSRFVVGEFADLSDESIRSQESLARAFGGELSDVARDAVASSEGLSRYVVGEFGAVTERNVEVVRDTIDALSGTVDEALAGVERGYGEFTNAAGRILSASSQATRGEFEAVIKATAQPLAALAAVVLLWRFAR